MTSLALQDAIFATKRSKHFCQTHVFDHEIHDGLGHEVSDGFVDDADVRVHQVTDGFHLPLQLRVHGECVCSRCLLVLNLKKCMLSTNIS